MAAAILAVPLFPIVLADLDARRSAPLRRHTGSRTITRNLPACGPPGVFDGSIHRLTSAGVFGDEKRYDGEASNARKSPAAGSQRGPLPPSG